MSQLTNKKKKETFGFLFLFYYSTLGSYGRYPHPGGSQMMVMSTRVIPVVLTVLQVDDDRCQSRAKV